MGSWGNFVGNPGPEPRGYANLSKRPSGPAKGIDNFSPSEMKAALYRFAHICAHASPSTAKVLNDMARDGATHGCRCDDCEDAQRLYQQRYLERSLSPVTNATTALPARPR